MLVEIAVPLKLDRCFDYYVPEFLQEKVGVFRRVKIDFHNRITWGMITGIKKRTPYKRKLKPLLSVLDSSSLFDEFYFKWAKRISKDYFIGIGQALELFVPSYLRKPRSFPSGYSLKDFSSLSKGSYRRDFFPEDAIASSCAQEAIIEELKKNRQVLCIVPTAKDIEVFKTRFGRYKFKMGVILSSQRGKVSFENWVSIRNLEVGLVVSTRMGIFSVMPRISLVAVFKEYDSSYYNPQAPFYHLVELAQQRAKLQGLRFITTGILPTLRTYYALNREINFPSSKGLSSRKVYFVEKRRMYFGPTSFSNKFVDAVIKNALDSGKRVLIIYDRRGYSRFLYCRNCGYVLKCPRCEVPLVYNFRYKRLICPRCVYSQDFKEALCPNCHTIYLRFSSWGVEKLYKEFSRIFPQVKVEYLDDPKDLDKGWRILLATRKVLNTSFDADIFVVLDADKFISPQNMDSSIDLFRILYQCLLKTKDSLVVCTSYQDFYVFKHLSGLSIKDFYEEELRFRRQLGFPPYGHICIIDLRGKTKKSLINKAFEFYSHLKENKNVEVSQPHDEDIYRLRSRHHIQILLRSKSLKFLHEALHSSLESVKLSAAKISIRID